MSFQAKVYKVFIASPSDVQTECGIVKSVLARWNSIHSQDTKIVFLPITWETNAAPELGRSAQDYINEEILDKCDILIGVFWTKIGTPTKQYASGSVEEVYRSAAGHKLTMLYFSQKPLPPETNTDQLKQLRNFKNSIEPSFYMEYSNEAEFESKLYDQLQIKIYEGKLRPKRDSDYIASINDDAAMVREINRHTPFVSRNLLEIIIDQNRNDTVWNAIIAKLTKSPADLRDSMRFFAKRGTFKHPVFVRGTNALAKVSQSDYSYFLSELYSINKYECHAQLNDGLLEEGKNKENLLRLINREENLSI